MDIMWLSLIDKYIFKRGICMKNKNRGISMISLMVVIVSIVIISSIAITAGYRFIQESKETEKSALVSVVSEAAYKRQNDYNVDKTNLLWSKTMFFFINILNKQVLAASQINNYYNLRQWQVGIFQDICNKCNITS